MAIDEKLLNILCCPKTRQDVRLIPSEEISTINKRIENNELKYVDGSTVEATLQAGLITEDGKRVYRIDDDIPVMLIDKAILI